MQEELNLNTPDNSQYDENLGLNYLAVAKVGIMVFADHIHDTYIASSTVLTGIWNSISALNGKTLVNIVGEIWDAGTTLLNNIKSGVSNLVEKVKAGMSYIANAVISAIIDGMIFMMDKLFELIVILINQMLPNFDLSISKITNGIIIEGNTFQLINENAEFKIRINDNLINLGVSFFNGMDIQEVETLTLSDSVGLSSGFYSLLMTGIYFVAGAGTIIAAKLPPPYRGLAVGGFLVANMIAQIYLFIQILNSVNDQSLGEYSSRDWFKYQMAFYYMITGFMFLSKVNDRPQRGTPIPKGSPLKGQKALHRHLFIEKRLKTLLIIGTLAEIWFMIEGKSDGYDLLGLAATYYEIKSGFEFLASSSGGQIYLNNLNMVNGFLYVFFGIALLFTTTEADN